MKWFAAAIVTVLAAVTFAGIAHQRRLAMPVASPASSTTSPPQSTAPAGVAIAAAPTAPQNVPSPASEPDLVAPAPTTETAQTAAPTGPKPVDPLALRAAARSVNVIMYSTQWCPQCRRAKAWLHDNDVAYKDHDVDESESSLRACKKLNPKCSIPTIDIDGEVIIGFGAESLRYAIDKAARRRLAAGS